MNPHIFILQDKATSRAFALLVALSWGGEAPYFPDGPEGTGRDLFLFSPAVFKEVTFLAHCIFGILLIAAESDGGRLGNERVEVYGYAKRSGF